MTTPPASLTYQPEIFCINMSETNPAALRILEIAVSDKPTLSLTLTLSETEVYPYIASKQERSDGNTITIVQAKVHSNDSSIDLSGRVVLFDSLPKENSGGHLHSGNRPKGKFLANSCTTNSDGVCIMPFQSSEISGIETITGTLASDVTKVDSKDLTIRFPGLIVVPINSYYNVSGYKTGHPENHYLSSDARNIFSLAMAFYMDYEAILSLNDMSLQWGGVFDLGLDWEGKALTQGGHGHAWHRNGRSVDIDKCAESVVANNPNPRVFCSAGEIFVPRNKIQYLCEAAGGFLVMEESYHCEF